MLGRLGSKGLGEFGSKVGTGKLGGLGHWGWGIWSVGVRGWVREVGVGGMGLGGLGLARKIGIRGVGVGEELGLGKL